MAAALSSWQLRIVTCQYGADKDKTDNNGISPLYIAAQNGHLLVVRYLVEEQGVDKDKAENHGCSPLHAAAVRGHLAVRGRQGQGQQQRFYSTLHCSYGRTFGRGPVSRRARGRFEQG